MIKLILKLVKKSWWIGEAQAKQIAVEAKAKKISESALMRAIIINWFEK